MTKSIAVIHGRTSTTNEADAVFELLQQLQHDDLCCVMFFCSATYDLAVLGRLVQAAFDVPVVGCTSAGQLGRSGYEKGGITAVGIASRFVEVTPHLLDCNNAFEVAEAASAIGYGSPRNAGWRRFGLVLVDGLSLREEGLMDALFRGVGDLPLIGGSAGDDLAFRSTAVYHDGRFVSGAAVLTVFETALPFTPIKLQHFHATAQRVVITGAIPDKRIVTEIDGRRADEGYAAAIGCTTAELPDLVARRPLAVCVNGETYIRSVHTVLPDGSIQLFCALEEGNVCRVAVGSDPVVSATQAFDELRDRLGPPSIVFGFDCILRRVQFEQEAIDSQIGAIMASNNVFGFSTYGEQIDSLHVNQTFTGLALGS
ncbi:MAG TPA: FIST N-terminal domain-containing protein [Myxococcota bacterium]